MTIEDEDDLRGLLERPTGEEALIDLAEWLEPYGLGQVMTAQADDAEQQLDDYINSRATQGDNIGGNGK